MTSVGGAAAMNTKAFQDLRTSDQRNFQYRIDASIQKKLENKQRVDGVGTDQAARQYEMERHLSNSDIRKQQKMIQKKMLFLKHRLEECRERHDEKTKRTEALEERERERMQREYDHSRKPRSRGRDTFVTAKFPAKNQPADLDGDNVKSDETPMPKRQKTDYHYEIIKKAPLSEPTAIWSVRRPRRTTDQETGRFLYRALTELEKVGEKHHEQYIENIKKLRSLEHQTGMRLDRRGTPENVKRQPWWLLRPETPVTATSSFVSQLELKEKELHRTIERLRQTYPPPGTSNSHKHPVKLEPIPLREQTLSMPENSTKRLPSNDRESRKSNGQLERKVTFVDDDQSRCKTIVATKEDLQSRKSIREIREIEREKLEDCNTRVAHFLNKENPNAKLPPPRDKFAIQERRSSIELPKINIFVMGGDKYRDLDDNPFMKGLVLPKVSRSRDLLDSSSKEMDAMWAWLGFETQEEFVAAVKGLKKSKKREKEEEEATGPQSELMVQLERAGVDASQLKKLAQLESMLPDGFNDLDLESDDDTEPEEEEDDPRFSLFDKKVISKKKKASASKKPSTKRPPLLRTGSTMDDVNKSVPIKNFKMSAPGKAEQTTN